jgi:HEAT repeat protein
MWFGKSMTRESTTKPEARYAAGCSSEIDLKTAIKNLAVGDWAQADQTKKLLLDYSKRSQGCRKQIIDALVRAMTKPNLDFVSDQFSYSLWLRAGPILGDLKAVEALDLLIDHLDLNDGYFSASMVHQPAVLGVEAMGVLAVPKLSVALQQNSKRNIRLAAALCLMEIGGSDAMKSLKLALRSESDSCVNRFIRISIEITNNELKSKTRPAKESYTNESYINEQTDLRQQLLIALKCDN